MRFIEKVLVDTIVLEPGMREAFAFDGAQVASTLSAHLERQGVALEKRLIQLQIVCSLPKCKTLSLINVYQ